MNYEGVKAQLLWYITHCGNILQFRGDLVDRETIYVTEPFPAAEDRAKYADDAALEATTGLPLRVPSQHDDTGGRA